MVAEACICGNRAWYSSNRQELPGAIGARSQTGSISLNSALSAITSVGLAMCSELLSSTPIIFLLNPLLCSWGTLVCSVSGCFLRVIFNWCLYLLNNLSFLSSHKNEIMYRLAGIIYLDDLEASVPHGTCQVPCSGLGGDATFFSQYAYFFVARPLFLVIVSSPILVWCNLRFEFQLLSIYLSSMSCHVFWRPVVLRCLCGLLKRGEMFVIWPQGESNEWKGLWWWYR